MPKYINADKIISHLNDEIEACENPDVYSQPVAYGTYLGLQYARSIIETAETVDVVQVVRCKDCKYFVSEVCRHDLAMNLSRDDNFCSYGERRREDGKIY